MDSERGRSKKATKKKVTKKAPGRNKKGQFEKGHKFSVGKGRPKMSAEQKALALTTRTQFKTVMSKYLTMTKDQVESMLKDPDLPAIDIMILKSIQTNINAPGQNQIDWFANHIYGKLAEKHEHKFSGNVQQDVDLSKLSDKEIENLYKLSKKCEVEKQLDE